MEKNRAESERDLPMQMQQLGFAEQAAGLSLTGATTNNSKARLPPSHLIRALRPVAPGMRWRADGHCCFILADNGNIGFCPCSLPPG